MCAWRHRVQIKGTDNPVEGSSFRVIILTIDGKKPGKVALHGRKTVFRTCSARLQSRLRSEFCSLSNWAAHNGL